MKTRLAVLPFVLSLLIPVISNAQWVASGLPACNAAKAQHWPRLCPDGTGGMIMVWTDERGADFNLYAQRIDANGNAMWTADGVAICTAAGEQDLANIVSDGAGGAIIVWQDQRAGVGVYDVYAQRVNGMGAVLWAANGAVISNAVNMQHEPAIISDNAGGAIMAWRDTRNDANNVDVYAQRVNSSGVAQWNAGGRSVTIAVNHQVLVRLATDGASGAIITWTDLRSGTNYDVYAQRMSAAGNQQWNANAVAISAPQGSNQLYEDIVSDGVGGAVIAWHDDRGLPGSDIYAQRVNSAGAAQWVTDGVAVSKVPSTSESNPILVADGTGGAFVAWDDLRGGQAQFDVYMRRISGSGVPLWAKDGIPICTMDSDQFRQTMISDGAGGVEVAWLDNRSGGRGYYAQRVTKNGDTLWLNQGVRVWPAQGYLDNFGITSDGSGGLLVAGPEIRSEDYDLFAGRIEGTLGAWGHPEPTVTSVADIKGDQGGKVKVNWKASGYDAIPQGTLITHYSVWRATDVVALASLVTNPGAVTKGFAGKATWVQKSAATNYYWELVGTQNTSRQVGYSLAADTRADSVAGNMATHHFMVIAHTSDAFNYWASNEMTGRSVDNLAPIAPLALIAQRVGNYVHLKWNRVRVPDLHNYTVYRKTSSGVTAIPQNFLSDAVDTVLTDTTPPASGVYYIVTATDVHANQGAASNEAAVGATTGVGNLPPIAGLMVLQNRPNPFTATSTFDIGLPSVSKVSLEVFDVAGRRVASRSLGSKPAGWQSISIDAVGDDRRPLASGVYFYRITAAGQTLTRKMVIAR